MNTYSSWVKCGISMNGRSTPLDPLYRNTVLNKSKTNGNMSTAEKPKETLPSLPSVLPHFMNVSKYLSLLLQLGSVLGTTTQAKKPSSFVHWNRKNVIVPLSDAAQPETRNGLREEGRTSVKYKLIWFHFNSWHNSIHNVLLFSSYRTLIRRRHKSSHTHTQMAVEGGRKLENNGSLRRRRNS